MVVLASFFVFRWFYLDIRKLLFIQSDTIFYLAET